MMLGELQTKLNDSDPHIRVDAAIALADLCSREETLHDRACAAWALPRTRCHHQSSREVRQYFRVDRIKLTLLEDDRDG